MASNKNSAAWIVELAKPLVVREAPMPKPGANDVLIRVHAVAINPVDAMRIGSGLMLQAEDLPRVIGCDSAGTVVAVGSDVKRFQVNDRVTGLSSEWKTGQNGRAPFQQYCLLDEQSCCKIPSKIELKNAAVLPLCLETACGMLFEKVSLNLDWPTTDEKERQGRGHDNDVVIVWGASSSVGANSVQLANQAGYRVIGLASKHNFDLAKACGAEEVFDYRDSNVVENVCKWVNDKKLKLAGVACAVGGANTGVGGDDVLPKAAQIARGLTGKRHVGTTMPRGPVPEPDLGEGITTSNCLAISQEDLHKHIWQVYLAEALELGQYKCLPKAEVVGSGLESIQTACDKVLKGVSGTKLVVIDI